MSKGLWTQMEESNKHVYTRWTGAEGMEQFSRVMRTMHLKSTLDMLKEWGDVTDDEYDLIHNMLASEHDGDFAIAEGIIENKTNQDESDI